MYELKVERCFRATHALTLGDCVESPHAHDWQLHVCVGAERLDDDQLVMDFHLLEQIVDRAIAPLRDANLNELPAFASVNASAERVAKLIYDDIAPHLPNGVRLLGVSVQEAPGCWATYR